MLNKVVMFYDVARVFQIKFVADYNLNLDSHLASYICVHICGKIVLHFSNLWVGQLLFRNIYIHGVFTESPVIW